MSTLRSAVSIARRLQDPLAELVKIDPKAIGIGQYQHDMPPARLDAALAGVVESCVNSVGVDLNTASPSLLGHIAGINAAIAKNIVAYREENGGFTARHQLLKVPKLGQKSLRAVRRLPAHFRRQKPAGCHRRPPGKLSHRRRAADPLRLYPCRYRYRSNEGAAHPCGEDGL